MALTTAMITIDSLHPAPLAAWWQTQLGGELDDPHEGHYLMLRTEPVVLAFQHVDDPTPGKNRLHLDLVSDDLDAEVDRLLAGGAGLVERRSVGDFHWVTLTDPDGNEFCVAAGH
jgi:predicted enzyme related to lactoylglutathione lyase